MVCWKIHRLASFSYRSFSRRTKTRGFPGHIWKNDRVDAADVCWCASAIPERPLGIRRRSTSTSRTCGEQQWFDQFDPTKMDDLQQICSQFMATRMGKMMINGMKTSFTVRWLGETVECVAQVPFHSGGLGTEAWLAGLFVFRRCVECFVAQHFRRVALRAVHSTLYTQNSTLHTLHFTLHRSTVYSALVR